MKKIRRNIGKLLTGNPPPSIWVDSQFRDGYDTYTIQIYGEEDIHNAYWSILGFTNKFNRGLDPIMYCLCDEYACKGILQDLHNDGKADIDFKKLDKFFIDVDKMFVVRRLE